MSTCAALVALACAASAPAWSATGALSTTVHPARWPRVQWPLPESPRLQQRIAAIIARMTVPEKVGQIIQADIDYVTPQQVQKYHLGSILAGANSGPDKNPIATAQQWLRLADRYQAAALQGSGIPLLFGADCVHGAQKIVGATLYPQNIALGATRDPALVEKIEAATAEEMRTVGFNWAFAPGVMVPQNDRWGRVYEGFSQNPALVARMARAAVLGFQGTPGTPDFLDARHVAATAKHFLGDGSTTDGIDEGDAEVSERDLIRVANAGYPPAIAAGVQAIMVSYSSWNGVKMSANRALLTDVLKRRMDFGGFLISDWDAVRQLPGCVGAACPKAIDAGIDMAMEPNNWRAFYTNTLREVEKGSIPMQRLDHAVARILAVKLRMGLFTQGLPSQQPLGGKFDLIGSAAHRALARQAVRESLVLLKNEHHLLPLKPGQRVLVAGRRRQPAAAKRRLDADLAGHRHQQCRLPRRHQHLGGHPAGGRCRRRHGRAVRRWPLHAQARCGDRGLRREALCRISRRPPQPRVRAARRRHAAAVEALAAGGHSRGLDIPHRPAAVGQSRDQRVERLRRGLATRFRG
ncbi:glycoside hydrolase family 3 domain protein [mine drainage metagenome]|uniref:Glycoside hydrolase family 3 domain protein n=1 Tax=mine drainage metagenome TaxID=410659 RepID=T0YNH1_9ZZZZ